MKPKQKWQNKIMQADTEGITPLKINNYLATLQRWVNEHPFPTVAVGLQEFLKLMEGNETETKEK